MEDPLEEDAATHSSILAWRIPWAEKAWQAAVHRPTEWDMTEVTQHAWLTRCKAPDLTFYNLTVFEYSIL